MPDNLKIEELEIPVHFDEKKVDKIWRVDYNFLSEYAIEFQKKNSIKPASNDKKKIILLLVDTQNTFCIPGFELFVAGAPEDNVRLVKFIYRNLNIITEISATLDTHKAMQIFHPIFLVDDRGNNPRPNTIITLEEIQNNKWRINPAVASSIGEPDNKLQKHLVYYAEQLSRGGKYQLLIWPYHAMLGGIGHAMVSSVEEALFFYNIARSSQVNFEIKGENPLTENYSALSPEVLKDFTGKPIADKNTKLLIKLLEYDYIIITGQAKSHCVAWTIEDLLSEIISRDRELAKKVFLLEDCTSPVVIPGTIDFTEMANLAFKKFANAGMNIVRSTAPVKAWPNINLN